MQRFSAFSPLIVRRNNAFRRHIKGLGGIAAIGLICASILGCSSHRGIGVRSSDSTLSNAFISAAFGREGRFSDGRLEKWCQPVGVDLPAALPEQRRSRVESELDSLNGLTAVDFRLGAEPGIKMHYPLSSRERDAVIASLPVGGAAVRRRLRNSRCFFVLQADRQSGCLIRADIVLPHDLDPATFDHCVAEEFSQAMGLPNDIDAGPASVFSNAESASTRTAIDDLFLKVLYDTGLKPGTARSEVEDVIPDLIRKHR